MERKKAVSMYLFGSLGQMLIVCIAVRILRSFGIKTDYTTLIGMVAIIVGGVSSALWGSIVSVKYRKISIKQIFWDFVSVKKSYQYYLLVILFLLLDFSYVLVGGKFEISSWYMPIILFLKAILFGGIEEIGWRYTFQPILEEKVNFIFSTAITFVSWGIWHFLYFYTEGTIYQIQVVPFLFGLLTNCFILASLFKVTQSLWVCVMTHALINMFTQIAIGGNEYLSIICKIIVIIIAITIHRKHKMSKKYGET
ncbi:CPBP family intramembrane glutamic endopeptidase [Clostridium intestinale]|uniref:CPBP family intramembrane glutamic endopeptidase n=1 Tax=Clostridium intestinale TaxID=36845 RepID=UPI002DD620DF|nr:CPBP family intramembrane glutamic endopeptidase [Clostridium intestinale]WRY52488.1 CPBP family intramembrane metalloprotease [Clostridium intestinale]